MAVFRIPKIKDYTVMSNHHLNNRSLSLKAKGLLSLMLSLPESWDYTLSGLAIIAKDGINSIRSAVKELEEHGYLERHRNRNEMGQLTDTEYIIKEQPEPKDYSPTPDDNGTPPASHEPENASQDNHTSDIDEYEQATPICDFPTLDNPILGNPTLDSPTLEKPTYENRMQLNTNIANKKLLMTHAASIHQSIDPSIHQARDRMDEMDAFRQRIKLNIEYDVLIQQYGSERMDSVVSLLTETISSHRPFIHVNGEDVPTAAVRERLLCLEAFHIEHVFAKLDANTSRIQNIRAYMIAMLYNAVTTMDAEIKAQVNHELYGDG